jgi:two-component system KDP operon response regulator KdpE
VRALIIADDQSTAESITCCLKLGYPELTVVLDKDRRRAAEIVQTEMPNLMIIESSTHIADNLRIISEIRQFSDVILIVLLNAETHMDRARYLDAGADQYIIKPFSPVELLAWCRALFRRSGKSGLPRESFVSFNGITINLATREVFLSGQPVNLTPTEYGLLSELIRNQGKVVTNRDLLDKVWGPEYIKDPNLVKTCIYRLRSKLKPANGNSPSLILSERGIGYRLVRETAPLNQI